MCPVGNVERHFNKGVNDGFLDDFLTVAVPGAR